jgi:di/tricarboxylate transporter
MTLQAGLAFGLVGATVFAFLWGRWRFDVIALTSLGAGALIGLIKPEDAFKGFANDIVIIIGSALVLSAAVAKSGIVDRLIQPFLGRLTSEATQVPFFGAATAVLSMATKNVGALALLMPSALGIARRTKVSPSRILMPMSFASLVGGLAVLVGTSPNIIVSGVREQALGQPFRMFDFMPVGGLLTVIALVNLRIDNPRAHGPRWSAELDRARAACATDAQRAGLAIAPRTTPPWTVSVPCHDIE